MPLKPGKPLIKPKRFAKLPSYERLQVTIPLELKSAINSAIYQAGLDNGQSIPKLAAIRRCINDYLSTTLATIAYERRTARNSKDDLDDDLD